MTTVAATSEQEAISKKLLRRQGIDTLPAQTTRGSRHQVEVRASERVPEEGSRMAAAPSSRYNVAATATTSQNQDHSDRQGSPKYAEDHSVAQQSAHASHKSSTDAAFRAPVNTGSLLASSRAKDKAGSVEPHAQDACGSTSTAVIQSMGNAVERPETTSIGMHRIRRSPMASRRVASPENASPKAISATQKAIGGKENVVSFVGRPEAQGQYRADLSHPSCTLGKGRESPSASHVAGSQNMMQEQFTPFSLGPVVSWSPVRYNGATSECLRNKRLPGWYLNAPVAPSTTCSPSTPHQPGHVAPTERRLTRMSEQDAQPTSVTEPPRSTQSHPSQLKSHSQDLGIVPPQRPISPSKRTSNRAATSGSNEPRARTPTQPSQHRSTVEEIERSLEIIAPLADADEGMREQVRELQVLLDRIRRRTAALIDRGRRLHQLRLALEREVFTDLRRHNTPTKTDTRSHELKTHIRASISRKGGVDERETHSETDEEGDMQEVEEMTSREVDLSDLPSPLERGIEDNDGGRSKRHSSPPKHARAAQWAASA
ncbi:hypothetical protein C8Q70DRAFT_1031331, partial [Cubamyces menziesii]